MDLRQSKGEIDPSSAESKAAETDQSLNPSPSSEKPLSLAEQALEVLETKCESCHNQESAAVSAFDFVTHIEKMIDQNYLIPDNPDESTLIKRIEDGTMPPVGSPQLTTEESELLKKWVQDGVPIENKGQTEENETRQFVTRTSIFKAASTDLARLPETEKPFIRYLSSTHLYNSNKSKRVIENAELGLNKLINTFSNASKLIRVQSIHPSKTLFRVNLKDFEISLSDWKNLSMFYPYHYVSVEKGHHSYLQEQTESTLPIMRIDWFLSAAGRPPLYYSMTQTPSMLSQLESKLGIDINRNIKSKSVLRSGFRDSKVSENHRVIERHDTKDGFLWMSYEFGERVGSQNIFANPLGPKSVFSNSDTNRQFDPGGHELFYSRPNGTIAFAVYNFAGERMHEAPALIKGEDGEETITKVVAGRTCHICHGNGPILKEDQISDNLNGFNTFERETIRTLYGQKEAFAETLRQDSKTFADSMRKIGIAAGSADPIASTSKLYEQTLNLSELASELNLSLQTFESDLKSSESLRSLVAECLDDKDPEKYNRSKWKTKFQAIANQAWKN